MDQLSQWISSLPLVEEDHRRVLAVMAEHTDAEGVVAISGNQIASALGISLRKVWRTVGYLERDGYVRRENNFGGSNNRNRLRNSYRIEVRPVDPSRLNRRARAEYYRRYAQRWIGPRPVDGSWLGGESSPPPRRPGRRARR